MNEAPWATLSRRWAMNSMEEYGAERRMVDRRMEDRRVYLERRMFAADPGDYESMRFLPDRRIMERRHMERRFATA